MAATPSEFVTCRCQFCDKRIEFDKDRTGELVACPHCSLETQLYVPAASASEPPAVPPPVLDPNVFLNERGILVTTTRFVTGSQTFALANITSVRGVKIPDSNTGPLLSLVIGLLLGLLSLGAIGPLFETGKNKVGPLLLALILFVPGAFLVLGAVRFFTSKEGHATYAVFVATAGSEIKSYSSRDAYFIERVLAALNDAIVARG